MQTFEFQTYIDRSTIEIPAPYREQLRGRARIIVVMNDDDDDGDMVEHLLNHPYQVAEITPLTRDEIYERRCSVIAHL